jgi:hypothetical protein
MASEQLEASGNARRSLPRGSRWRPPAALALAFGFCLLVSLASSASAHADVPPILWDQCTQGSGAGQCVVPRGIVSDPATGDVYVADLGNNRIQEFTVWGGFVRAFGWDVAPDGAPGDTVADQFEVCTATCQAGASGPGAGEFGRPEGLALDSVGDIFVVELDNHRVQKFHPTSSGVEFEWMVGGGVNQGPSNPGNLCTAADLAGGDVCGAGTQGSAPGQFGSGQQPGNFVAVGPSDQLYVGDVDRIQQFNSSGTYVSEIPLAGQTVQSLATSSTGNLYVAVQKPADGTGISKSEPDVLELSPGGATVDTLTVSNPRGIATEPSGDVYVLNTSIGGTNPSTQVLHFDASGDPVPFAPGQFGFGEDSLRLPTGIATGSACGVDGVNIYVANSDWLFQGTYFARSYGPAPDPAVCPPPSVPPTITDSFASDVRTTTAALSANINPHFWPDASYHLEYGTSPCSGGGCASTSAQGLTTDVIDRPTSAPVELSSLEPGTTYYYRYVATSSGGGPVVGPDKSFTTYPTPDAADTNCPNQSLRVGVSLPLADCRAYEAISPRDKQGGAADVAYGYQEGYKARLDQASTDGNGLTYSTFRAFGSDAVSAPFSSQYIAKRDPAAGWVNRNISPPRTSTSSFSSDDYLLNPVRSVSDDLCSAYMLNDTDLAWDPSDNVGHPDLYRRDLCSPDLGYELLTTAPPANGPAGEFDKYFPAAQGASVDGSKTVFRANGKLTNSASSSDFFQLYIKSGTTLRPLSILPNGSPAAGNASVGLKSPTNAVDFGGMDSRDHAVSQDASHVYFTVSDSAPTRSSDFSDSHGGPGRIYLRLNPDRPQSPIVAGACTDPTRACTLPVSETVGTSTSFFHQATPDGSKALFSTLGGDLYRFDAVTQTSTLIAGGLQGVVGASSDLGSVFFVSGQDLASGATADAANLYLWTDGGGITFVATLSDADIQVLGAFRNGLQQLPAADFPWQRSSRVTPDGQHLIFTSLAPLTGADNTDAVSGKPDGEIFSYDVDGAQLRCISCNRTGARPTGRAAFSVPDTVDRWAASELPGWDTSTHPRQVVSDDGQRVLFTSFQALDPRDVNDSQDIYQWETAGKGSCDLSDSSFNPAADGCVTLISSGTGHFDSQLIDGAADGHDVFFSSDQMLAPQDKDTLIDIYDARVDGGFAPALTTPTCIDDACQGPLQTPPVDPGSGSSANFGPGNQGRDRTPSSTKKKKHKKHKKHKRRRHG